MLIQWGFWETCFPSVNDLIVFNTISMWDGKERNTASISTWTYRVSAEIYRVRQLPFRKGRRHGQVSEGLRHFRITPRNFSTFSRSPVTALWVQFLQVPQWGGSLSWLQRIREVRQRPGAGLVPICGLRRRQAAGSGTGHPLLRYACSWLAQRKTPHTAGGQGAATSLFQLVRQQVQVEREHRGQKLWRLFRLQTHEATSVLVEILRHQR